MMNSLSPGARRQSMLEQQQRNRITRQLDQKKRGTNNSNNDKLLFSLDSNKITKKKPKLNLMEDKGLNEIEAGLLQLTSKNAEMIKESVIYSEKLFLENEKTEFNSNGLDTLTLNVLEEEISEKHPVPDHTSSGKLAANNINEKENIVKFVNIQSNKNSIEEDSILGIGHLSALHAFVRDYLFKKIKIISNQHLETGGEIMKLILKKLRYSEQVHGNLAAFANACRTEVRKTICSRRGYVKRQIGILLTGKEFFIFFLIFFKYLNVFCYCNRNF
jgi:hypothetical protein